MLHIRNLNVLRRMYLWVLNVLSRFVYGRQVDDSANAAKAATTSDRIRLRKINSELEFGASWSPYASEYEDDPAVGPSGAQDQNKKSQSLAAQLFADIAVSSTEAADAITGDSLTRCFTSEPPELWNFMTRSAPSSGIPMLLVPIWLTSVYIRWCILLPIRIALLFLFCLVWFPIFFLAVYCKAPKPLNKFLLQVLASALVTSWGGLIRYHGKRPVRQPNQIYVANHTSMIDAVLMYKDYPFALVAQRHGGVAGILQDFLTEAQSHVWFDRDAGRDRKRVAELLRAHVRSGENEPIMVFPEGTCVNNEYCLMFKKGSFELGATVYPVAIRYNKNYADAFWNSSSATFSRHLLDLMTSWAVVADVWYLPPATIRPGETATQFSSRVKKSICEKADLISVNWDGFLKRRRISPKFLEQRQRAFASVLHNRIKRTNGPSARLRGSFSSSILSNMDNDTAGNSLAGRSRTLSYEAPVHNSLLCRTNTADETDLTAMVSNRIYLLIAAIVALAVAIVIPVWGLLAPASQNLVLDGVVRFAPALCEWVSPRWYYIERCAKNAVELNTCWCRLTDHIFMKYRRTLFV